MQLEHLDIRLLNYEVDIILEALLQYCELNNEKYNFRKVSKSENETNEKFLIRNTYEHIQNCKARKNQALRIEATKIIIKEKVI